MDNLMQQYKKLQAFVRAGQEKQIMAKGLMGALRNRIIMRQKWLTRQKRSINYNSFGNMPLRNRRK